MQKDSKRKSEQGKLVMGPGPKEQHFGGFSGFSFWLIDPRLGVEEAASQKVQCAQTKKAPKKNKEGQPRKIENFRQ